MTTLCVAPGALPEQRPSPLAAASLEANENTIMCINICEGHKTPWAAQCVKGGCGPTTSQMVTTKYQEHESNVK